MATPSLHIPPGYSNVSIIHTNVTANGSKPTWSFGVDSEDIALVTSTVDGWVNGAYTSDLSSDYRVVGIQITQSAGSVVIPVDHVGTRDAQDMGPNCAALLRKGTNLLGKHGKGRMYWPGWLPRSQVNDLGLISDDWVASIQGTHDALVADLAGASLLLFLFHHVDTIAPTNVDQVTAEKVMATQRRRLRK